MVPDTLGSQILRPHTDLLWFQALVFAALTFVAIAGVRNHIFGAAFLMGFSAARVVIIAIYVLTDRLYLVLSPQGFTEGKLFGPVNRRWEDVGNFRPGLLRVKFDRSAGTSTYLASNYGLSTKDLAALMQSWRQRRAEAA